MTKKDKKRFIYPQQHWSATVCARLVKHVHTDGMGTPYGFKGYVGHLIGNSTDYNGGTVIDDHWYVGVIHPTPTVAEGYALVHRPTWGWQLVNNAI